MLIYWDEPKRALNLANHGLDFADVADQFDWEATIIDEAQLGAEGQLRYRAVGYLGENLVTLIFSLLGTEAISVISLRPASRKERSRYNET